MIPVCFDLPNDRIGLSTRPIVANILNYICDSVCNILYLCQLSVLGEPLKGYILLRSGFSRTDLYLYRYTLLNPSSFVHVKKSKNAQIVYLDYLAY